MDFVAYLFDSAEGSSAPVRAHVIWWTLAEPAATLLAWPPRLWSGDRAGEMQRQ